MRTEREVPGSLNRPVEQTGEGAKTSSAMRWDLWNRSTRVPGFLYAGFPIRFAGMRLIVGLGRRSIGVLQSGLRLAGNLELGSLRLFLLVVGKRRRDRSVAFGR